MPKVIDLGGFQLKIPNAIRELNQDLKDDWFPDPLRYKDCIHPDTIAQYFETNIDRNHGVYVPHAPDVFNVPKKNFLLRYSLETNLYDRLLYLGLVSELIPHFDPLLETNTFSHRFCGEDERRGRYIFKHGIEQFKAFEGIVRHAAGDAKTVLITDVFNYFENIQVEQITACLEHRIQQISAGSSEKIRIRRVIDLLGTYLKVWTFNGSNGLPQNRDASSFLANILMDSVDKKMKASGFEYFRYMDDIRVVCKDHFAARQALKLLSEELRKVGLNLNSQKTVIGKLSQPGMSQLFVTSDRMIEALDNMLKSRSISVATRALPYLRDYAKSCMHDTQSRGFRFAVKRIEMILSCPDLRVPIDYFDEITDSVITTLEDHPVSSDMLVKYLTFASLNQAHRTRIVELLSSEEKALYSWQNYLLWSLLILREIFCEELLVKARSCLTDPGMRAPDIGGACLYLGKFGSVTDKHRVLESFPNFKSAWLQRQAMIGFHEIPFKCGMKDYVQPYVLGPNIGTYSRIRSTNIGKYCLAPEPAKFTEMFDGVSAYE